MQVFKTFMKIIRSKMGVAMIYVGVFLGISIPMATSSTSSEMFAQQTKIDICIFDEDNTSESRALTDLIGQRQNIVQLENDRDAVIDALYYARANYVLIINEGYAEKLASGDTDELFGNYHMHDSYAEVFIGQFLNEYVSSVRAYIAGGEDISSAIEKAEKALSQETEVRTASFEDVGSADYPIRFSSYFRYMPYVLISVLINALCPALLAINRNDIRFRTNCSCVKPAAHTLQIFAGSGIFVLLVWVIFVATGAFMYGGIYQGKAWLAVLNSFIFALVAASIAIFISTLSPSQNIVNLITQVIGLGMSFMCGIFVDQSILSDGVLAAARFLPAYWYVRANNMLAGIDAFDSAQLTEFLVIEFAFAAVLAILTLLVRRLKYSGVSALKVN
ncbi:MAG: ABC transporter permease [Oscillospiraceae bacterium]|nr:ABC transporter permease [Oscillospiraceae bacterium]